MAKMPANALVAVFTRCPLSVARRTLTKGFRGFASPPYDGFAFVGVGMVPHFSHRPQCGRTTVSGRTGREREPPRRTPTRLKAPLSSGNVRPESCPLDRTSRVDRAHPRVR